MRIQRYLLSGSIFISILFVAILAARLDGEALNRPERGFPGRFPRVVLWAWERPEDLSFIDKNRVGVAYLARTVFLQGEKAIARPRFQPLKVPPGTFLIAVARIESSRFEPASLTTEQRKRATSIIEELGRIPGISAIQIDFDAKTSERSFYREMLFDLRRELPDSIGLSITALASWCIYDDWLSGLPIDEAVPMLFRMGVENREVIRYLEAGGDFHSSPCSGSLGISTDERLPKLPSGRRLYIFSPKTWSKERVFEQKIF